MPTQLNRRDWLKRNSLAAIALGFSIPSMANEEGMLRSFGADKGLINLGSNENPYGFSPKAKEAMIYMMTEGHRYQFNVSSLDNFEKELAQYYKVGADQVLTTAGSGEALIRLATHFNKGNLVTATPTFGTLPNTAKRIGTKVTEVPLTNDKVHDLPAMMRAMDNNTKMVYICNPANPTSTVLSKQALINFCIEASKNAIVVIDEAYIDFLPNPEAETMIPLIEKHPNIIVVRTFSKIHAMAGLRVGFIVAHPSIIHELDEDNFYYSQLTVSNLTLSAALASLQDEAHRQSCKQKNAEARKFTIDALTGMGYKCIPSSTNFVFFSLGNYPGDFSKDMLQKNVIVRSNTYPDGKWGRVSIGTMDEMKQFINLMKS